MLLKCDGYVAVLDNFSVELIIRKSTMAYWINICFAILVGVVTLNGVSARPSGAPEEACDSMTPRHAGTNPSALPPPFTITVSPERFTAGEPVRVTIQMNPRRSFKGFMIMPRLVSVGNVVRPEESNDPLGSFKEIADTQHVCERHGLTHTRQFRERPRTNLTVEWSLASGNVAVGIQFRVTLVENRTQYWVDERSAVAYDRRVEPPSTSPPTTARSYTVDITEGCGKTKGCYRNPPACSEKDCDILVTWKRLTDRSYEFEMSANTNGWVALGLSDDKRMGDDDVVECIRKNDVVHVQLSKNDGKDNTLVSAQKSQSQLSRIEWDHSKGRLRCQFIRTLPLSRTRGSDDFMSKFSSHHLLMAKGPVDENGKKKRHSLEPNKYPYISPSMVDLKYKDDITDTARYLLVKAHGCLMLIAWMMCASTALLLAKYYKRMWPNNKLCGVEVWFAVHRALMIVCLILTAIAFILIFIHVGGYSQLPDYPEKAHPPLGICVMILVILNPIITLCRCKPNSKYRPIFNWFHWLFGTVGYVLMLPAIFIGLNLHKAFVPWWATWIISAFVLFHLIIELMLEIHGCLNARKQQRRDDDYNLTQKRDFKGEFQGVKEEPVGHRFKKIILSIYLVVNIILNSVMVLAVAFG